VESAPRLLIAGAGHIGRLLAGLAVPLGFDVHVIDDRADYANPQRLPPPVQTTAGPIEAALAQLAPDANTYVVIVTRGHKHDEKALQAVLGSPAKYIGMIGSRRKVAVTFDDLKHAGATDEQLARVHAPIGLSIGAVTTEEIAVSIVAQLVSIRRCDRRKIVEGPTPVSDDAP
ncbi:MAG: XdhC family protein, partial [Planctomycetes bacterium]|nr:XdhC family protein [Planctomycetota bacterium]